MGAQLAAGRQVACEAFPLAIEHAAVEDGKRTVRGVANSFRVMRSGRMIHPDAVAAWLEKNPGAGVPLMAQHGYVSGFATIGKVTSLSASKSRGLTFAGELATGVQLADEAWTLVEQKMLAGVSIGWLGNARIVSSEDADLDDFTRKALKDAGQQRALMFTSFELLEISLVDVADDRHGKLAARLDARAAELAAGLEGEAAVSRAADAEARPDDEAEARRLDGADAGTADALAVLDELADHWEAELSERQAEIEATFPRVAERIERARELLAAARGRLSSLQAAHLAWQRGELSDRPETAAAVEEARARWPGVIEEVADAFREAAFVSGALLEIERGEASDASDASDAGERRGGECCGAHGVDAEALAGLLWSGRGGEAASADGGNADGELLAQLRQVRSTLEGGG